MSEPTKNSPEKPSLEELLRFKKAEKPDAAFWGRFDNELHQRMMRTLVKKDPWPVQLMHGLSGRIGQSAALAGAAALLAFAMVQPGLVTSSESEPAAELAAAAAVEVEIVREVSRLASFAEQFSIADYRIDTVSSANLVASAGVSSEYHLDSIQLASYGPDAYTADSVISRGALVASAGSYLVF